MKNILLLMVMITCWGPVSGLNAADASEAGHEKLYHEYLRPQFHFTARYWDDYRLNPPNHEEGWINDLNGLVYNDGVYHLFAQRWWSAWLHAVSTDLIHWKELRPAFGKGGKFGGTQSGGGVVDINNTSGLGDGTEPPMIAFWSSTDNLNQCISYSLDKGQTWSKYDKNPVLVHPYRDPKVFWYEPDQKWIMVLYGPGEKVKRIRTYGFNGQNNDAHHLGTFSPGQWNYSVVRLFNNGGVCVNDQNGKSEGSVQSGLQNVSHELFAVGSKAGLEEFLEGDIAEILVYDRTLSDEETEKIQQGLQSKWSSSGSTFRLNAPSEGLALHLDAAKVDVDENQRISCWNDLSGNGNDMLQSDADLRPYYIAQTKEIGEHPVVRFMGKQFLEGPAIVAEGDDSITLIAVWRRVDQGIGFQAICEQNSKSFQTGRRASLLTECKEERENVYLFFESTNLLDWKKLDSYVTGFFECPDMIELPVDSNTKQMKWVIIDGSGDYAVGSFDGKKFTAETEKRKGDYGRNFYATMTFQNMPKTDPRRIQLAWMRGWNEYPKDMPFNQQITFPCELTLHKSSQGIVMHRYPISEISTIYDQEFSLQNHVLKPGENPLSSLEGDLFDIDIKVDISQSTCSEIVLNLRGNIIQYDVKDQVLQSVGSKASLFPKNGIMEIRILMDRLSIETFGNQGEVSITNVAYQKDKNPNFELITVGGEARIISLVAHKLKSIWP